MSPAEIERLATIVEQLDDECAVVLVEHDLDFVFRVARNVSVLHLGSVLMTGTAAEVRASDEVARVYLGGASMRWLSGLAAQFAAVEQAGAVNALIRDHLARRPPRSYGLTAGSGGVFCKSVLLGRRRRQYLALAGLFRCRRRDSNPRHADHDSAALWLYSAKNGGWGTEKGTLLRLGARPAQLPVASRRSSGREQRTRVSR